MTKKKCRGIILGFLWALLLLPQSSIAAEFDWPMWRYDAGRTAASPGDLPDEIHLLWMRQYPARIPVWDDPLNQDLMTFDRIFEPVVSGKTLLIGFNDTDKVTAIDTDTGREKWSFYTDGPVRLPPAVWGKNVYFTSDDGFLYCLSITDGALAWKFSGAPGDRRILGNSRLISTWPARGGVVVRDGVVYFAAGIWPFMGVFIYALDAVTGKALWVNDGEGARYMLQPHNAPAFAGVAPQGALALAGNRLIVPGGRSVPACFDSGTGKFLYYELAANNKAGGSFVAASDGVLFNHTREKMTSIYNLTDGLELFPQAGGTPVIARDAVYFSGESVRAFSLAGMGKTLAGGENKESGAKNRKRDFIADFQAKRLWDVEADATGDLIRAGKRLYAAGKGTITALEPSVPGGKPATVWSKRIDGMVERLIAADGKLFAVTLDGRIMAFGSRKQEPVRLSGLSVLSEPSRDAVAKARDVISATGIREGYALLYGATDADFTEALAGASEMKIVVTASDRTRANTLRQRFDRHGLAGGKIAVLAGDFTTINMPPYLSSLTILNTPGALNKDALGVLFQSLRPYGGTLLLPWSESLEKNVRESIGANAFLGAQLSRKGEYLLLVRDGPLPGAGEWTHNLGTIANTSKSDDRLVTLPLGILWFGGSSNLDVLPRHAHGPSEQVVGGRLFIEGIDCMSARDVYTGRVIWKTMLRNFDTYDVYYDESYKDNPTSTEYNQEHIPGANIRGTNFVAMIDRVYVIQRDSCHVLDSANGKTLSVFSLPPDTTRAKGYRPEWGYIGVYRDWLIAGRDFVPFSDVQKKKKDEYSPFEDYDRSASRSLFVLNRYDGKPLWKVDSEIGFLHNGIAVGNGRIHILDKYPPQIEEMFARRGKTAPAGGRLITLDLATGKILWEDRESVFGSFLAYSEKNDLLVQSMRPSRDMSLGEVGKRMRVVKGSDGTLSWDKNVEYKTFPIIHNQRIITESGAIDLMTGSPVMRTDPLTGLETAWSWKREYGCNYPIACEHLLSFRSGAAGFYDLDGDSGTGNFGGFKSGCTATLIAADGVLNAPDYTRTCSCSYQNQTSLALVSMPDNEMWTYSTLGKPKGPIHRLGVNFGAPGDRMAVDGALWLEYPPVGGSSPEITVKVAPETVRYHRLHSSRINGNGLPWVTASGCTGARAITITLSAEGDYTVRLFFAEPEELRPGQRVFDVSLQGNPALTGFDIAKEAGGTRKGIVKEFKNIRIEKDLVIGFNPAGKGNAEISGVEVEKE